MMASSDSESLLSFLAGALLSQEQHSLDLPPPVREHLASDTVVLVYEQQRSSVRCTLLSLGGTATQDFPLGPEAVEELRLQAMQLEPYLASASATAGGLIEQLCDEGYQHLVGPLEPALADVGAQKLVVIPQGRLARVPFHLFRDRSGRPLADRFVLTYLPSWQVLDAVRPPEVSATAVMVLADPKNNLPIARGTALGLQSEGVEVAVGEAVTQERVLHALERPGHLLICCHADSAGLQLADGVLSAQALRQDQRMLRRATVALIACKSAHAPSALFTQWGNGGFPEVLLGQGVGAVVASPWDLLEFPAMVFASYWAQEAMSGRVPFLAYRAARKRVERFGLADVMVWLDPLVTAAAHFEGRVASAWLRAAVGLALGEATRGTNAYDQLHMAADLLYEAYPQLGVERPGVNLSYAELRRRKEALEQHEERAWDAREAAAPSTAAIFGLPVFWAGLCYFGLPPLGDLPGGPPTRV